MRRLPSPVKVLVVFGTRPEAIKLSPVIMALRERTDVFDTRVCVTAQHRDMLDQVLRFFAIRADYDLDLMRPNQTLFDITARAVMALEGVMAEFGPDHVIVQGDTTTTLVGALCAYYGKVKVSHVEAGLRSGHRYAPYPEELNRILTGHLADYHFAPTEQARRNLAAEGIRENVWVVGNTVIDALLLGLKLIREHGEARYVQAFPFLDLSRRVVLITGHRRESFGEPFEQIAQAVAAVAETFPEVQFVYPVHRNPNVREPVGRILGGLANVHLIDPLDYPDLIWLMNAAYVVVTDSGGIQEEAPALGKPVLVMRDVTERTEGLVAGTARLVGTRRETIVENLAELLTNPEAYQGMARAVNPYGDGTSSRQIVDVLLERAGRTGESAPGR
jgi:UDP-N-acetylglucosamine 2-epimerase (non-hydrolysing)